MNKKEVEDVIREYAETSLKEMTLEVTSPKPYQPKSDDTIHSGYGYGARIALQSTYIESGWLNTSHTTLAAGDVLIDSRELTLVYIFGNLTFVFRGGVQLSKNKLEKRGEFFNIGNLWFKEDFAISLAGVRDEKYRSTLVQVLSCPYNTLAVFMVDEQPGVRELAKMRYKWTL